MSAIIGKSVEIQLLTTLRCNLRCSYCSEQVGEVLGSQRDPQYSMDQLDTFIQTNLSGLTKYFTFYGGEPTLNLGFIAQVMRRFPDFGYQLQTNGTRLHTLPSWMLKKLSNILISVDGGEKITDGYRGKGIYSQVLHNASRIRDKTGGTITARVTWGDPNTSFEELDALTDHFDYVYWQFACGNYYQGDAVSRRKEVISRLVEKFLQSEHLYPFIPIMGIVRNKLFPEVAEAMCSGESQCRASTHLLNVSPDGKIFPCPDMMYMPDTQTGSIQDNWLKPSPLRRPAGGECETCSAFDWCRGNCVKNLILGDKNPHHQASVVSPICELIRFIGEEVDKYDIGLWWDCLPSRTREKLLDNPIYQFVEVMP